MSYDFSFFRFLPRPSSFPFSPSLVGPWKAGPLENRDAIEEFFATSGLFRFNGIVNNTNMYRCEDSNQGILYVFASDTGVHLGVHARWTEVAKLYELLLQLEPGLLIADHQTAVFYDAPAFGSFIRESAERMAELKARESER